MALPDWSAPASRRLAVVLAVHVAVLGLLTTVAARTDTLAGQIWVLNVAVASQIVASGTCAIWLFQARRAVLTRVRRQVLGRSDGV